MIDVAEQYRLPFNELSVVGSHGAADTFRLHWDIITICNLNCSYCYARKNEKWNVLPTKQKIDVILNKIKQIDKNVEIILLGGEPTLHPLYFYILDQLSDLSNVVSISIISNAQTKFTQDWIDRHQNIKNFFFNVTFHPTESNIDQFLTVVDRLNPQQSIVNVLMYGPQADQQIKTVIDHCVNSKKTVRANVPFHPVYTEKYLTESQKYKSWLQQYSDFFERYLYFKLKNNDVYVLNDIDVYINNLNNFQGWQCLNNNWSCSADSVEFTRMCKSSGNESFVKCKLQKCSCQGLLSVQKYSPS